MDGQNIDPDYLFGDGALLGYDKLSGLLPGGWRVCRIYHLSALCRGGGLIATELSAAELEKGEVEFMKKTITILIVLALLVVGAAGCAEKEKQVQTENKWGWGPERETFTMKKPADHPVFNSITDNPTIGDERDFVRIGEINADVTDLANEVEVAPGRQYLVYIYFHNNASSVLNDSEHDNSGVAMQTRISSTFTSVVTAKEKGGVSATITADNSSPESVWDGANITTVADKVELHYVEGSAKIYNDWDTNGSVLPSSLFSEEGTLLGLTELNGVIPGCEEYHGVVSYVLQAE